MATPSGTVWANACRSLDMHLHGRTPKPRLGEKCAYCGDPAVAHDHLRPLMGPHGLPSGFGASQWNLVPACTTCNCSKGKSEWRKFMARKTGKAPLARGVNRAAHLRRMKRLEDYEAAGADMLPWVCDTKHMRLLSLRKQLCTLMTRMAQIVSDSASQTNNRRSKRRRVSLD